MTREAPTLPPPGLLDSMVELRKALERVSELCAELTPRLAMTQLAVLTSEHRVNVLAEHDADHEQRLRRLEGLLTDPSPAVDTAAE